MDEQSFGEQRQVDDAPGEPVVPTMDEFVLQGGFAGHVVPEFLLQSGEHARERRMHDREFRAIQRVWSLGPCSLSAPSLFEGRQSNLETIQELSDEDNSGDAKLQTATGDNTKAVAAEEEVVRSEGTAVPKTKPKKHFKLFGKGLGDMMQKVRHTLHLSKAESGKKNTEVSRGPTARPSTSTGSHEAAAHPSASRWARLNNSTICGNQWSLPILESDSDLPSFTFPNSAPAGFERRGYSDELINRFGEDEDALGSAPDADEELKDEHTEPPRSESPEFYGPGDRKGKG